MYINIWLNLRSFLHNSIPVGNSGMMLERKLLQHSMQTAGNVTVMKTVWNESVF